jgi:hypothetical protein
MGEYNEYSDEYSDEYNRLRLEELEYLKSKDNYVEFVPPSDEQEKQYTKLMDDKRRKMEFYKKYEPLTNYILYAQDLLKAEALLKIPNVDYTSPIYTRNEEKTKNLTKLLTTLEEKLKLEGIELEGTDFNEKLQDAIRKQSLLNKNYSDVAKVKLGGSKSRRRHSRHRKPVRKTRRGRGRKSKAKPKTHRRRRHSRARKHKKYTRKH